MDGLADAWHWFLSSLRNLERQDAGLVFLYGGASSGAVLAAIRVVRFAKREVPVMGSRVQHLAQWVTWWFIRPAIEVVSCTPIERQENSVQITYSAIVTIQIRWRYRGRSVVFPSTLKARVKQQWLSDTHVLSAASAPYEIASGTGAKGKTEAVEVRLVRSFVPRQSWLADEIRLEEPYEVILSAISAETTSTTKSDFLYPDHRVTPKRRMWKFNQEGS
ncbi:MAG: hypothetical protein IIC94_07560 [Chloroflexi bacterium]|nr:hypothetical protein [Chloroflexota bacterium]